MPRDLKADQEMLRSVLALAESREIARAAAMAEQALANGFEHPLLLNVAATRLEQEGKFEDALRLLQRAVALAPADIAVRHALALCLQRLNQPTQALYQVDELLKMNPDLAVAHANKGNALISLGQLGKAKLSHQRALELDPRNLAARIALASIATHRGEHVEARAWARSVLNQIPGHPEAVMSLAAAELAVGSTDNAQLLVCQLLADPRSSPNEKAMANGLLGDILDAAGCYAQAFDAYAACNEEFRHIHRRYADESSVLAYTHALKHAVQAVAPERWALAPQQLQSVDAAGGHVFLIGFPRSGTTLLEVVLDGHPRVVSLEEHELLTDGVLAFMREPLNLEPLLCAGEVELNCLRAAYWQQVREAGVDVAGKLFIDKHPLNTLKLPLIARLFPNAKILFAYRDPRDVVLSCFRRRFSMNAAMYQMLTLQGAAAFYAAVNDFAEVARPRLGLSWQMVRYESLVDDLPKHLHDICEFIGLEWVSDLDDFAARAQARERATPSTAQLARGLNRAGIGHWRHYNAALAPMLPMLEPWVQRLGYGSSVPAIGGTR